MQFKSFMEALKGNQHKIDKNKNGKIDAHDFKLLQKEEQEIDEMTDAQMKKREEIVKSMKKDTSGFKDRYGDRAKEVMYATATKMAMKEEAEELDEKSDQAKRNKTMKNMMDASRGARFKLNNPVPDAEPEHKTARAHNVAIGRALRNEEEEVDQVDESKGLSPSLRHGNKLQNDPGLRMGDRLSYRDKPNTSTSNPAAPHGKNLLKSRIKSAIGKHPKPNLPEEANKENPPFDGPYTKTPGTAKDKSGAVHTPMSRAKHLAKMAMKKQMKEDIDRLFEKDDSEYNYEGEMAVTQLKTITRHAEALQAKMQPDTNLPEWVQSKITLATDYMQTAHDYLMSELDEQAPVAPVPGMKFKNHAVMVHPETKSRVVINRKNVDNYTSDGYKEVRPGQKLKEDDDVKFSYTELMMINEIKLADLPVRRVKGHSYGADYSDPEGADDYDDKKPMKPAAEKRGRGRPAGAQSGARKNYGSSKLHTK